MFCLNDESLFFVFLVEDREAVRNILCTAKLSTFCVELKKKNEED
jgi:hypothetical protein